MPGMGAAGYLVQLRPPRPDRARRGRPRHLTVSRRLTVGAGAVAVLAVALIASAVARPPAPQRAAIMATSPADGATLAVSPTEVDLAFSVAVDPGLSHLSVREDGSGMALAVGQPRLIRPELLRQPVRVAARGGVTVDYHVTLIDGTVLAGTLRFHVGTGSAGAGDATTGTPVTADGPGIAHQHPIDPISALLLALDGIVVIGAIVLLVLRPPRRGSGLAPPRTGTAIP